MRVGVLFNDENIVPSRTKGNLLQNASLAWLLLAKVFKAEHDWPVNRNDDQLLTRKRIRSSNMIRSKRQTLTSGPSAHVIKQAILHRHVIRFIIESQLTDD